jgi:hypothetical protein
MPEGYLHLTCEQRCQIYALLQSVCPASRPRRLQVSRKRPNSLPPVHSLSESAASDRPGSVRARGPSVAQRDARLKAVCRFVRYVRVEDARHGLPPINHFGARKTRRSPHIVPVAKRRPRLHDLRHTFA